MKQHILVTGGAGFIGSHLVDALVQRGHEVTVIDLMPEATLRNLNPLARNIQADLTKSETIAMVEALAPDVIFHFAANASVPKSVADPIFDMEINYVATANLLDVASKIKVKRFIFASTGGGLSTEYTQLPTPEHAISKPLSPYAKHKLASEALGEFYALHRDLPFVALRFANVYGPRQAANGGESNVIATFAHNMVRGNPTRINGTGLQTRDYIYVTDVIEACLLVLEEPTTAGPLNVGSGRELNVITLHRAMSKYLGYTKDPTFGPADVGAPMRSCLDITLIRATIDWKPKTPIPEGLRHTLEWHREKAVQDSAQQLAQTC